MKTVQFTLNRSLAYNSATKSEQFRTSNPSAVCVPRISSRCVSPPLLQDIGNGIHTFLGIRKAYRSCIDRAERNGWIPGVSLLTADSTQLAMGVPADDVALVHASKAGNLAAFEELVSRYDRRLLRVAQNITHNFEDAQDVVQETFLKAFQKLHQFQENSKFSTWLIRIALNQSLMALRKQQAKQRKTKEVYLDHPAGKDDMLPVDLSDWRPNPEQMYKVSEFRNILARTLQELRPALRVVFVLRDIEGYSLQETAEVLGISVPAIKTRSLRARLQLRERLSKYFRKEVHREMLRDAGPMCPAGSAGGHKAYVNVGG
jgi:RNA polymerase sigma-70 factor, ECF subfamily